tara:strand:- start:2139 stop:2612 length:474 start_codon:yes stop_codon:yes gene_type:complete
MKLFTLCFCLAGSLLIHAENINIESNKSLYFIDGDSINLRMRIAGIDTPEINQKCRKSRLEIIDCGILSKIYLKELMEKMPGELVISVVGTDHYGRLLVKVLKGGVNIGEMLVKKGMAFSYKDNYRLEENKAKQEGVGFWSFYEPPIEPYKWRKSNK